jgi:dTDP-glucose 4,6-dehydratase
MTSLLVTGGAGFIGANFVQYWLRTHPGDRVVVLDALTYAGNLASLGSVKTHPGFVFVHGDIRTPRLAERLLREHGVTLLVHFAAESHVDRSIEAPGAFISTNIRGTHELLGAARKVWLDEGGGGRFHHVSTDEVYGSLAPTSPPSREGAPYSPNSPYAASKAASDHLVRAYYRTYGLSVTTSHCSNNYGPYQFPEKLIPLMLVNALDGRSLPVHGDGLNVRDWLYVEDHCRALEEVATRGLPGETYNIGGGNEWTNIEVVMLLCHLVDEAFAADASLTRRFPLAPAARGEKTDTLVTFVKDRLGNDRRYAMDTSKIERELGFLPQEGFGTGIRRTIAWYFANEAWWRGVMGRMAT